MCDVYFFFENSNSHKAKLGLYRIIHFSDNKNNDIMKVYYFYKKV